MGRYVIVDSYGYGIVVGDLKSQVGRKVRLHNARKIMCYGGASSLEQLATNGTLRPSDCDISSPIAQMDLHDVLKVIDCTPVGEASIRAIPPCTEAWPVFSRKEFKALWWPQRR